MRYLLCLLFVISSVFAQPIEGPWTLDSWTESSGAFNLRTVGSDTVDIFWDTSSYPEGSFVYHAVCVLGQDSFLIEPHTIPGAAIEGGLGDVILLPNGEWLCAMETEGTEPQITLVRGFLDAILESNVIYEGQMQDETPCWGDCWEFKYPQLSMMPDGNVLVAGAIWYYFYIGGATEVDGEPYVFVVNPDDLTVEWEASTRQMLFGENRPVALADDSVRMITSSGLGGNSSIVTISQDSCSEQNLNCRIHEYPEHLFVKLSSSRLLATSDQILYELHPSGICEELGTFQCPYNVLDVSYFADYGFLMASNRSSTDPGIVLSRLDTNGMEISTPGHVFWPDSERRVRRASSTITDDGLLTVFWIEDDPWPGDESRLRYVTLGWNEPLPIGESTPAAIPASIGLSAYPNPFNSTVKLSYELATAGDISLSIFNLYGQKVVTLVNERAAAGSYEAAWMPAVSSGVYFARLETQYFSKTAKLLYLR